MTLLKKDHPSRCILWRRLDQPGYESAQILTHGSRRHLQGTAVFAYRDQPCRLDYAVVCNSQWRTLSARVAGWVGMQAIQVELLADSRARWRFNEKKCAAVTGCTDVDLNFSPSTNLLPIRRLRLAVGQQARVRAAWLRFPEFTLEPLPQIYRRLDDHTYRYESADGKFVTQLVVDDDGLVMRYPEFWRFESGV